MTRTFRVPGTLGGFTQSDYMENDRGARSGTKPPCRLRIRWYSTDMTLFRVGKEVFDLKLSVLQKWSHGESNPDLSLAKAPFYR